MDEELWFDWVSDELEVQGISRREFCKNVGISRNTLWKWKTEHTDVKLSTILRVLDYLGYDLVFRKKVRSR